MRLNSNLILRQVGGEYMIVNPFSETMDMAQVYSLNEQPPGYGNNWKTRNSR